MVNLLDFRGNTVVLTFVDGHCDGHCPLLVPKLGSVEERLGKGAKVAFVGVSVNP